MDDPRPAPTLHPAPDGSGLHAPAAAPTTVRSPRRWPWILVAVLALGAAVAASVVALDQRDVAAAWEARAVALEGQRDEAARTGEELVGALDGVEGLLAASEADVSDLEERLRVLADQLARAEDTATTVAVERDVIVELTTRIADATESLDVCITQLFELQSASVAAFNRTAAGEAVEVEPLNAQAQQVTTFCNEARSAAASAAAAADRLADG